MSDRFGRYIKGEPAVPILNLKIEDEQDNMPKASDPQGPSDFERELEHLINRHSLENHSGTPDFILAAYLNDCLVAYNKTVLARSAWRSESVELPALQELRSGVRTVPMVVTSPNGRMINDIGEAKIKLTPGEEQVPLGRIEKVIAVVEPDDE